MTTDRGFAPPGDQGFAPPGDRGFAPPRERQPRFVHCAYCHVLQPVGSAGTSRCVSCGAPIQRWVAHPPPGGPTPKNRAPSTRPYAGPPSYRGGHPRWSFPPVVWRDLPAATPTNTLRSPTPGLRWATWLAVLTAALAVLAAGAETWRFVLMLQGRKLVLSGDVVRASDLLVAASGTAVLAAALLTAAVAVPALRRTHALAADRLGQAPSRTGRAIVARLLVPFWNVYGAGQIVMEIDAMLTAGDARRRAALGPDSPMDTRPPTGAGSAADAEQAVASAAGGPVAPRRARASRLTALWWLSWIVSSVLLVVTLAWGFGGSLQAIADTVELHIAVDLAAAVVAGLGAALLHRFARLLAGPKNKLSGWVVKPPDPTRPVV